MFKLSSIFSKSARDISEAKSGEGADEKTDSKDFLYIDQNNVWITNEGLLRDEGVLFGWANSDHTDKTAAIEHYFEQQKAKHLTFVELAERTLSDLQSKNEALKETCADIQPDEFFPLLEGYMFRNFAGLIIGLGAAYGTFFIIDYYLTPAFGISAAIGVFLFALFSIISPISNWLQLDTSYSGKLKEGLLEIGTPVVSALFVSYIVYRQTNDRLYAVIIALFLLFLFFFAGKLILGLIVKVTADYRELRKRYQQRRHQKAVKAQRALDLRSLRDTEEKLAELQMQINEAVQSIRALEAEKQSRIKVFLSELKLARTFSDNLIKTTANGN